MGKDTKRINIFNNQIYYVHFGDNNIGSEQSFDRPALVVRTTKESPVCTVLPPKFPTQNYTLLSKL